MTSLTIREREVLQFIADGHTDRSTAAKLMVSEEVIAVHVKRIFAAFGVHNRVLAVIAGIRAGLIVPQTRKQAAPLSPREHQALQLLARGLSDAKIAAELGVGKRPARGFVVAVYRKLDVERRSAAVSVAYGLGLIDTAATR